MKNSLRSTAFAGAALLALASGLPAATVTLTPAGSVQFSNAFGLAFDGTHLHVSTPSAVITEISTDFSSGLAMPTGNTTANPAGWSALAWSGTQLVGATGNQVYFFDKTTGANQTTVTLPFSGSLIDGLDVDRGGEIFWSRDVAPIDRFDATGALIQASIPVPPSAGFSGVEYINDANLGEILVVVNDAFNPRRLSVAQLDGTLLGEATFANSRYEDLAFDGNFLYAADYFGGRIDKYGVAVDGVVIGDPPNNSVPDSGSTMIMLGSSLFGLMAIGRRIRRN